MPVAALSSAIASVPPGDWAVAVSGGADSVALLRLFHARGDVQLHGVHLDHQTRGHESTADAGFVRELAATLNIPCTIALRSDVEATMPVLPANASSRYRAARIALFRQVITEHRLAGVLLAHHADDLAETVLLRLLRGSGPMGLAAMEKTTDLDGLILARPLLHVRRYMLRDYLQEIGQAWREDASNASDKYLRNRLRRWLATEPTLVDRLLNLGEASGSLRRWARHAAPALGTTFRITDVADFPPILAAEAARRWLIGRGVPPDKILPAVTDRLISMAQDAASPPAADFPGGVRVRRKGGVISATAHLPPVR